MPLVTEAGFGFGGAYGRGVLQIKGATVDYYSATKASIGFQIGAQQYAHMLFFTTDAGVAGFPPLAGLGGQRRYSLCNTRPRAARLARKPPSLTR